MTNAGSRSLLTSSLSSWAVCNVSVWVAVVVLAVFAATRTADAHGTHHGGGGAKQQQPHQHQRPAARSQQNVAAGDTAGQTAGQGGFHDSKVVHDTEHINEHLQGKAAVNISQMSLEELEFHYFKMHDFDNNTKLDGLEILKALTHLLPYEDLDDDEKTKVDTTGKTPDEVASEKREKELEYYTEIVDNVLKDDDIDDDGYLTYPEYILARRREEARELREEVDQQNQTTTTTQHDRETVVSITMSE